MFTKILLASDGSDHAMRATEKACFIAKGDETAKVTIVYVIDGATSKTDVLSEGSKEAIEEKRKRRLQNTEEILINNNVPYEIKVLRGEPGPSIVKYSNENMFDLVVIGSRGLNTFQEMVLGSVSHKVAKRVQCPVMIVK
ncbi:universal stress protein [Pseudalkalibacillus salsuginis]|uniref:universal stress protein n=1 Tax=Pseudalkalibacillus salsuginis TaxID=2910972 RepID=UPI001F27A6AA|nr:universal stress protein [Pseudalkalibacillus salsuginis]MCF6410334.1 universal stress protein [Pseudalkalibacillus salsuginis]